MGRHKRRRSRSCSTSISDDADRHSKNKKYRKDLKRKESRIEALQGLIKEFRKKNDNHGETASESSISRPSVVRYV